MLRKLTAATGWSIFQYPVSPNKDKVIEETLKILMKGKDPKLRSYYREMLEKNWSLILRCQQDGIQEHLIAELEAAIKQIDDTKGKEHYLLDRFLAKVTLPKLPELEPPSVVEHFAKTYLRQGIGAIIPTAVFAYTLNQLLAPAAAQELYSVFAGVPEGLESLCGLAKGCVEGWIGTNDTVTQFSRKLPLDASVDEYDSACLTSVKVGNSIVKALDYVGAEDIVGSTNCTIQYPVNYNQNATIQVNDITQSICDSFGTNVPSAVQSCSQAKLNKADNIIIEAVLGTMGFLICCGVGAGVIACFRHSCPCPSSAPEPVVAIELGNVGALPTKEEKSSEQIDPPEAENRTPGMSP